MQLTGRSAAHMRTGELAGRSRRRQKTTHQFHTSSFAVRQFRTRPIFMAVSVSTRSARSVLGSAAHASVHAGHITKMNRHPGSPRSPVAKSQLVKMNRHPSSAKPHVAAKWPYPQELLNFRLDRWAKRTSRKTDRHHDRRVAVSPRRRVANAASPCRKCEPLTPAGARI